MNKIIKISSAFFCALAVLIIPHLVLAASLLDNMKDVATNAGFTSDTNETTLSFIIGTVVATVLSLMGVIFVALIVYSGIMWMTAEGDEEKVKKAKKTISNAIIGLVLTVSATAIYYIVQKIFR
jgi:hypothetical protein